MGPCICINCYCNYNIFVLYIYFKAYTVAILGVFLYMMDFFTAIFILSRMCTSRLYPELMKLKERGQGII